jgi:hypothetical protein
MLKSVQSIIEFATCVSCPSQALRSASEVRAGLPARRDRNPTIPRATLILMSHSTQFSFPCSFGTLRNTLEIFSHREDILSEQLVGRQDGCEDGGGKESRGEDFSLALVRPSARFWVEGPCGQVWTVPRSSCQATCLRASVKVPYG